MTLLTGRLHSIQHKVLPNILRDIGLKNPADKWINTHVQSGVEGEPENLTSKIAHVVSHMDEEENYIMKSKRYMHHGPYYVVTRKTSLGYQYLSLAVFKGKNRTALTEDEIYILNRFSSVGANGLKTLIEPKDIAFYMNMLKPLLNYLIPRAQAFVFFDCHSGQFNIKCSESLHDDFGVSYDKIIYTSKRHPDIYYKKLWRQAEKLRPHFKNGKLLTKWAKPYILRDTYEDPATGLKGRHIHKSGKTRNIPQMDQIIVHVLEDKPLDNRGLTAIKEYYYRTGHKALVVLCDDTMSQYANTAKSVVNQLGPYADVIVIVAMLEY
jgi:hypothetical protein